MLCSCSCCQTTRPGADQFPAEIIGNEYEGWPGEKWLDIRPIDMLALILRPFIKAGKPVFAIEYTDMGVDFTAACAEARSLRLSMLLKHRELDAYREACP